MSLMSKKRTLQQSSNNKNDVSLQQNPAKRQKLTHNASNTKPKRTWSSMELYCIMQLIVHEDVRKYYASNSDLDASLFTVQDWQEISDWMTEYFSKSQPEWFTTERKPLMPYTPSEIKQCAINVIKVDNHGILPKQFAKLFEICTKHTQIHLKNAITELDKNTKKYDAIYKQRIQARMEKLKKKANISPHRSAIVHPHVINKNKSKIAPIPLPTLSNSQRQHSKISPKTQIKTDENTCKKHLMSMLKKLSQYNDKTQATMHKKLEDKYGKLFAQGRQDYSGQRLAAHEKELLVRKDNDWAQYKQTIANKVSGSWQENVMKLQNKFAKIIVTVMPQVKKEYLQQNPNDETIKLLFKTPVKVAVNSFNNVKTYYKKS